MRIFTVETLKKMRFHQSLIKALSDLGAVRLQDDGGVDLAYESPKGVPVYAFLMEEEDFQPSMKLLRKIILLQDRLLQNRKAIACFVNVCRDDEYNKRYLLMLDDIEISNPHFRHMSYKSFIAYFHPGG